MTTTRSLVARRPFALLLTAVGATAFTACGSEGRPHNPDPQAPAVVAPKTAPAISGGTMIVQGSIAIAADPDRDRVYVVDLQSKSVVGDVALEENDEPGRLVLDAAGNVHVALRKGGAIATIELATGELLRRTPVCGSPRGVAFDAVAETLHVACETGELVSLDSATGEELRRLRLDRDLRDVIVQGDKLLVTRFKTAELLVIGAGGEVLQSTKPAAGNSSFGLPFEPSVAYRTLAMPDGSLAMVHQRSLVTGETTPLTITPGGYYNGLGCENSVVHGTVSVFTPGFEEGTFQQPVAAGSLSTGAITSSFGGPGNAMNAAILPVDIAVSPGGNQVAVVSAGNDQVYISQRTLFEVPGDCGQHGATPVEGQPIAVAFSAQNQVVVQLREPAALQIIDGSGTLISLSDVSMADTGHEFFHSNKKGVSPVACASCHPEGGDDARVWNVNPIGPRRTQTLGGGLSKTLPLHWDGDMAKVSSIMNEVFVGRMGGDPAGGNPTNAQAMERWLDTLPAAAIARVEDEGAVTRGDALFNDGTVGCAGCHSGEMRTNNTSHDVGTGGKFQVPMLKGIASRAPYMHDGCAPTLKARFLPSCGGGDAHGKTSHLSAAQIDDLVAFLETL